VGDDWRLGIVPPALIRGLLLATLDPRQSRSRFLIETAALLARRAAKIAQKWCLKEATVSFFGPR